MFNFLKRKNIEKKTVYQMIEIYCQAHHKTKNVLCDSCQEIYDYAVLKSDKCPFGKNKPVCSKCKVHCYKSDRRDEIRIIMRYSGPRMLFYHPINTIIYFYYKYTRKAPETVNSKIHL
ncbi:MAG: nitrous oxide-stimulated promoter family protein [Bacteroidota bacterium]|nr:nitrous oxide-stimulated promoter family protein [Bacteroidota bacterium]